MKNSLFKRAIATAATVPLALTQCLTIGANAVEADVDNAASTATETAANSSTSFTLDRLLYIAPDKDQSEWNLDVFNAIDKIVGEGKTTGTVGTQAVIDAVVKEAGQYADFAEAMLSTVSDVQYTIDPTTKNTTITANVGEIADALEGDYKFSLGRLNKNLAAKYGDASLADIDYSSVKTAGQIKIEVSTGDLAFGTDISAAASYTTEDGTVYDSASAIIAFAKTKINELKQVAYDAIDKSNASDKEAAKADVDKEIGKYNKAPNNAVDKIGKFLNYSNEAASVAELFADVDAYVNRYTNRELPTSFTETAGYDVVKSLVAEAKDAFNTAAAPYTLDG